MNPYSITTQNNTAKTAVTDANMISERDDFQK
jgi:hypothetical protein